MFRVLFSILLLCYVLCGCMWLIFLFVLFWIGCFLFVIWLGLGEVGVGGGCVCLGGFWVGCVWLVCLGCGWVIVWWLLVVIVICWLLCWVCVWWNIVCGDVCGWGLVLLVFCWLSGWGGFDWNIGVLCCVEVWVCEGIGVMWMMWMMLW